MAKKVGGEGWKIRGLKEDTFHAVLGVIFFVIAALFVFAAIGKAGVAGEKIYLSLSYLFGYGYYLLPSLSFLLGISFFRSVRPSLGRTNFIGSILFLLSGLGIIDIFLQGSGGIIGRIVSYPMISLFEVYISLVALSGVLIISLMVILDARPGGELINFFKKLWPTKRKPSESPTVIINNQQNNDPEDKKPSEEKIQLSEKTEKKKETKGDEEILISPKSGRDLRRLADYNPPPLSLFERDKGKPDVGDIKSNAAIIKRTLQNFGIDVEMDEVTVGPTVTRYSMKPAEGVKLSKIMGLKSNLEYALAAHPLRIEAPIPGKSLVGIEIPNAAKSTVGMASVFSEPLFKEGREALLLALGRSVSGKAIFANMAKMPHLLIAGATGSGKSVTIHSIINSLLFRNAPEDLRFIMIDPKRVELTLYKGIPHLLTPVITESKKAIMALKWAGKEMDRRYDILESESVRDIDSYHSNVVLPAYSKAKGKKDVNFAELPERMPYIVIVIDELADIMSTYPRELEAGVVRLAQMSRAVGIHLLLSTQRPSVNVITGLIKANIPTRIALQVSSQIDSRTILDQGGAETLVGQGDMLYLSGEMSKPERVQSAYISETEVKKVVSYLSENYKDEIPSDVTLVENNRDGGSVSIFDAVSGSENMDDDDELYEEARKVVAEAGKASSSFLQRRLKVGYARAARLIDMLEERGVVGPGEGAKPRDVLQKETNEV